MKLVVAFVFIAFTTCGQPSVVGKWTTVDDDTGKDRSIVEIVERNGVLTGRIVALIDPDRANPVCDKCEKDDVRYNKPIIGMEIIQGMTRSGSEYGGGSILDPEDGRTYRCKLWLEGPELMVRGYWGPFYRTQTWRKST